MSYQDAISKVLNQIQRPGCFASGGIINPVLPGLFIKDVGTVALPLQEFQAKQIQEKCSPSPYGVKGETLYDESFRKTSQLDVKNFQIQNKSWNSKFLKKLMVEIAYELGLPEKSTVKHKLYKMLLYDNGSFFKPHRDTEKVPGMFATLVICLPSRFTGGELVVNHMKENKTFDFAEDGELEFQYAAFYADCVHEVKELTSGYRMCLIYNLFYATGKESSIPRPVDNSALIEEAVKALQLAEKEAEKTLILLNHKYSKAELFFNRLKNDDFAKVDCFRRAGEQMANKPNFYLAIFTRSESEDLDERCYLFAEDDDEKEISYELTDFVDINNKKCKFSEVEIHSEKEIIGYIDPDAYDEQEKTLATGNEAAHVDRWYSRAVFVIIPQRKMLHFAGRMDYNTLGEKLQKHIKDKDEPNECIEIIQCILDLWSKHGKLFANRIIPKSYIIIHIFEILLKIDNKPILEQWFVNILIDLERFASKEPIKSALVDKCRKSGLDTFHNAWNEYMRMSINRNNNPVLYLNLLAQLTDYNPIFESLTQFLEISSKRKDYFIKCVSFLRKTYVEKCEERRAKQNLQDKFSLNVLLKGVMGGLENWLNYISTKINLRRYYDDKTVEKSVHMLICLILESNEMELLENLGGIVNKCLPCDKFESRLISIMLITRKRTFATEEQQMMAFKPFFDNVHSQIIQRLKENISIEKGPWITCQNLVDACQNKCDDCKEVQGFLDVPEESVKILIIELKKRAHIEKQINSLHVDILFETLENTSPQTLVLSKVKTNIQKQIAVDKEKLKKIESFMLLETANQSTTSKRKLTTEEENDEIIKKQNKPILLDSEEELNI